MTEPHCTSFELPLRSFAKAHRRTPVRLSLEVKPASRWFASNIPCSNKKRAPKGAPFLFGRIDWTTFTTFKLPLRSFAKAHRRTPVRLSLEVKPASRRFASNIPCSNKKRAPKGAPFLFGRIDPY